MFCHKATRLKRQKIHHKSLNVINQSGTSYDDLLQLNNSVPLHQRHLGFLLTETCKSTGTLKLQFMWSYFKYRKVPYNLTRGPVFFIPPTRSTIYGTNSVHFLGSLIWNRLPNLVQSITSISEFKNVIKKSEILTAGAWYVEESILLANFHVILVLFSFLCSSGSVSHQALYPL